MVSGFLISPYDQERICSGLAMWMRIWSKVSDLAGLAEDLHQFVHAFGTL